MFHNTFRQTVAELDAEMEEIMYVAHRAPESARRFAKHIDRQGTLLQYAYYVNIIKRYASDSNTEILDWGGQYGQVTKLLLKYYKHVTCYLPDRNQEHAKYFHENLKINEMVQYGEGYERADRIYLPDSCYDVVVSSGVLEHTRECDVPEKDALIELNRVLRPDGLLFIWNLPRKHSLVESVHSALGRSVHSYKYTRASIRQLLDSTGFEIEALEQHELLFSSLRHRLGEMIGHVNAFNFDFYVSRVPPLNLVSQHFTIVARKRR